MTSNPLGLVGVPRGYFDGPDSPATLPEAIGYSTNQAFTLTDSPLDMADYEPPGPAISITGIPNESSKAASVSHHTSLTSPTGGTHRGISGTPGARSHVVTASLAKPRTPLENPRRPPLRSTSLQVQPVQQRARSGSLRGQVHRLFDRRASDSKAESSRTRTESLKGRISGPSVTVVGIAADRLDGMLDLRNLSVEEEDGSVYDESGGE